MIELSRQIRFAKKSLQAGIEHRKKNPRKDGHELNFRRIPLSVLKDELTADEWMELVAEAHEMYESERKSNELNRDMMKLFSEIKR
jgi:hypothetical protein